MPRVRFEPTIPAFERAKTVHALDRAATVIGLHVVTITEILTIRLPYLTLLPSMFTARQSGTSIRKISTRDYVTGKILCHELC
jgi:hypothetical protein